MIKIESPFSGSNVPANETDPIVKAVNGIVKSNGTTIGAVVSGTDIKTINSNSILGSGNLVVGAGTVTQVSVTTANGISGSVATDTTTPAITLSLGAITPSSVNSIVLSGTATPTLAVTGTTTVSGANTGDTSGHTGLLALDQTTPQSIINGKPTVQGFQFNNNPTVDSFSEGKMYYDVLWKTMSLNIDTDVTLQIGEETLAYCKNNTGSAIVNGQVVYIVSADGGYPTIDLADARDVTKSFVLGVVTTASIAANGGFGHVTIRGHVNDLITNTWSVGTSLYLSDTTPGALTLTAPSAGNYDVRVGRVMISNNGAGRIYVNVRPMAQLTDLGDVTITTPALDQVLTFNGVEWVNGKPASSSASTGIEFFNCTPVITARTSPAGLSQDGTVGNGIQINSLSKTPVTTAEQTQAIAVNNDTRTGAAWIYDTVLGRTTIDSGVWDFTTYASVNNSSGTHSITRTLYQVVPGTGTLSFTGTGDNSRTATITDAQYDGTYFVASATNTAASFIQATSGTNKGIYQITAMTDGAKKIATVTVRTGYTNETGVTYNIWNKLFSSTTSNLTSTSISTYNQSSAQPAFTIAATDKLGSITFVTSSASRTITLTYDGNARNTHLTTPLITLHNNLAGLQGGSATERYHLTSTEYTATASTGSGAMARLVSPAFTTPNIGSATGSITGNAGTVTVTDEHADTTTFPLFVTDGSGSLVPHTNSGITYDSHNFNLTTTTFTGELSGNASTVTTNANLTGQVTSSGNATTLTQSKSFIITNPTATADSPVWRANAACTITAIHYLCIGGTSITGQLYEYDENGANGATVDTDTTASAGTNTDNTTLDNPGIDANHYVGWKTTSVSGVPTQLIITFEYTI